MKCLFDGGQECIALTEKKCEGCKFCKTEEEYRKGQVEAAEILKRKNLIATRKTVCGKLIMSTEFYRRW